MNDPADKSEPHEFESASRSSTVLAPDAVDVNVNGSQQKKWFWLFWIIISIAVLILLVLGHFIPRGRPSWQSLVFVTPAVLISCLLGAYAGFGNHSARWIIISVSSPFIGWYMNYMLGENTLVEFEILFCGIVAIVAFTTLILRRFAGDLRRIEYGEEAVDALQFGIRDLLIWTTAVASFVAIGQRIILKSEDRGSPLSSILFLVFTMAACLAIPTVINIWALFGQKITSPKCLVVAAITFLSVVVHYFLFPFNNWFFAGIAFVNQVLVVVLIVALRKQGYRFVKRNL